MTDTTTDNTTDTPRIYVACLASYNAGILHGEWIDATDADTIREAIQEMLKGSPSPGAEEWAIHDYGGFGSIRLSEWEDIDRVAELGALIDEHGEAFAAYADHVGVDYATEESFQDAYCGDWDSEQAYAENLFDELYAHDAQVLVTTDPGLSQSDHGRLRHMVLTRYGKALELGDVG